MTANKRLRIEDIPRDWIISLLRDMEDVQVSANPDSSQLGLSLVRILGQRYREIPPRYKRELEHFMDLDYCTRIRRSRRVHRYADQEVVYDFTPCDEMQVVFIHIPKTAGESIAYSLFGTMGIGHVGAESLHRVLGPDFWEFFVFTFVRNPFSRLVSAYEYLRSGGHPAWENNRRFSSEVLTRFPDFEGFVNHMISVNAHFHGYGIPHFRPQADFVTLDGQLATHFVGHFETLHADIQLLGERLGREIRLQPRNVSSTTGRNIENYFGNDRLRDNVIEFYRRDFELFRYSLNPASPSPT